MKGMTLSETISKLLKMELKSQRKGYGGDAAESAAKRHMLILLSKMGRKKRESSTWNLFAGKYLKQGKTIKEAAQDWKKIKIKT